MNCKKSMSCEKLKNHRAHMTPRAQAWKAAAVALSGIILLTGCAARDEKTVQIHCQAQSEQAAAYIDENRTESQGS